MLCDLKAGVSGMPHPAVSLSRPNPSNQGCCQGSQNQTEALLRVGRGGGEVSCSQSPARGLADSLLLHMFLEHQGHTLGVPAYARLWSSAPQSGEAVDFSVIGEHVGLISIVINLL